jgi:hypothetical protein
MALLYSYQNREPAPLPERIRMPDGMTVRPPLSAEQLGELGYAGPISVPSYDPAMQVRQWDTNDMVYRVFDLAPQEIEARARKTQEAAANYRGFYDGLISGAAYQDIRSQAITSLPLTVACTEFIAAMGDAKAGVPNLAALQACFDGVLAAATLTDEHLQEIYTHLAAAGIWGLITLGDFEPEISEPTPEPEPEPAPAPEPTPEPEPVVITPEDEGDDTIIFSGVTSSAGISSGGFISGGTSSAGITSGGFVSGDSLFGGSGEDVVTFDDPLD